MARNEAGAGIGGRSRRWSVIGLVIGAVVVVGAAVSIAAWIQLRAALDDLAAAREELAAAEEYAGNRDLVSGSDAVIVAERHLGDARARLLSSAPLQVVRVVPVLGQNVDAARDLTERAFALAATARRMIDAARPLNEGGLLNDDGTIDNALLGRIKAESSEARALVEGFEPLDLPSSWALLGRVEDAAHELAAGEEDFAGAVTSIDKGLGLVGDLIGIDDRRRWLIVAANSAEMRGAGGMVLSFAVIEADHGDVSIGTIGPDDELQARLDRPVDVPLPADYATRYGRYGPTADIRNATLSADFTVGAPVIEAIYEAAMGQDIDGVIQVDPMALRHILGVIGEVRVPGVGKVDADSVVDTVLSDLYSSRPDQEARQDALASVAAAVFEALFTTDADPFDVLDALGRAIEGRNLMLHSTHDGSQALIEAVGAAGTLAPATDSLHLAVQNFGANKLDYYLDTELALTGTWPRGEPGTVTAAITIANRAPDRDEPRYVFGPNVESMAVGLYRAHAVLYLPAGTSVSTGPSGSGIYDEMVGTEDGRPVVTFAVDVPAGASVTVEVGLELAPHPRCAALTLIPSPRVRPTTARVDIRMDDADLAFDGRLSKRAVMRAECE